MKLTHCFLGIILVTLLSLGVVQQRVALVLAGYEVERISLDRDDLLDRHRVLNYNVLTLRSPVILNHRLAQRRVELAPPRVVEVLAAQSVAQGPPSSTPLGALAPRWARQTIALTLYWLGGSRQAVAEPIQESG